MSENETALPPQPDLSGPQWHVDDTATGTMTGLGPHLRCDCTPDLGPAHCHRCSKALGRPVPWGESPCHEAVESDGYQSLAALFKNRGETDFAAMVLVSVALDALAEAIEDMRPSSHHDKHSPAEASAEDAPEAEPVLVQESPPWTDVMEQETPPEPVDAAEAQIQSPTPMMLAARPQTVVPVHVEAVEQPKSERPPAPWQITSYAENQLIRLGLSGREVVEMLLSDEADVRVNEKNGINHYVDDLLILADLEDHTVISVITVERGSARGPIVRSPRGAKPPASLAEGLVSESPSPFAKPGSLAGDGAPKVFEPVANRRSVGNRHESKATRKRTVSGGRARKGATTAKEMIALLNAHGFEHELRKGGHYIITLPSRLDWQATMPATPSDKTSYKNCIQQIKRDTGIDIAASD